MSKSLGSLHKSQIQGCMESKEKRLDNPGTDHNLSGGVQRYLRTDAILRVWLSWGPGVDGKRWQSPL